MITIKGKIVDIKTYKDNGWGRFLVITEEKKQVVCVGIIYNAEIGDICEYSGQFEDKGYGLQFTFKSYKKTEKSTDDTMTAFLRKGFIKHIGPKIAENVIESFGDNVIDIFENNIYRLSEVKGITDKKLQDIADSYIKNKPLIEIVNYFKGSLTKNQTEKIYLAYGDNAVDVIEQDPYKLYRDIDGFGFLTVDAMALKKGISKTSSKRISAAITYTLEQQESMKGHIYLEEPDLKKETLALVKKNGATNTELKKIEKTFTDILFEANLKSYIFYDGIKVYRRKTYLNELESAQILAEMIGLNTTYKGKYQIFEVANAIAAYEERKSKELNVEFKLNQEQKAAIFLGLNSKIFVLTGGPGCGKTTTIEIIADCYAKRHGIKKVILLAPTGRAAQRIEEQTGYHAMTIHMLLTSIELGRLDELKDCLVIVDETSMVDNDLLCKLLKKTSQNQIIFVGDQDQLQSVGCGAVLKDLLSMPIPSVSLVQGHRNEGSISINCRKIKRGSFIKNLVYDEHFQYIPASAETIQNTFVALYRSKALHYGMKEVMAMAPQHTGLLSVNALNERLQNEINGMHKHIDLKYSKYYVGDRVMQTRNNYKFIVTYSDGAQGLGIFNGDRGTVVEVGAGLNGKYLIVEFDDGKKARYEGEALYEIELSFVTTVHKCQGSEAPCAIFAACLGNSFIMNRNILYTAASRAKKEFTMVGETKQEEKYEKNIINIAIKKTDAGKRNTYMSERVLEYLEDNLKKAS